MQYRAHVTWLRRELPFETKTFDRTHTIHFGSGFSIEASSAPEFLGNPELPNPEELFAGSIASCFMLTFLYWAAMKGLVLNEYKAEAIATLAKNTEGKMAITEVLLKLKLDFDENKRPDEATLNELLHKAHDQCFISNSIKTQVKWDL